MSRNSSYRGFTDRNGGVARGGDVGGGHRDSNISRGQKEADRPMKPIKESSGNQESGLSGLEKRLSGIQQDFTQAIHKIGEKENEKFDLIFAILSELQQRQGNLEESVRGLKAQYGGNGYMVPNDSGNGNGAVPLSQPQQQPQFSSSGPDRPYGQMNGQMGGQMNSNMGNQQPMQQYGVMQQGVMQQGVMQQADGTQAMFTAMPQPMIIMSPPANGGMQYAAVPQMMTPAGAVVQQMPAPMAMQLIQQQSSPEMGVTVANGQDAGQSQPSGGSSIQAQMDMMKADGNNGQQPMVCQSEAPGSTSESSSQEGKVVDDSIPCPDPSMT